MANGPKCRTHIEEKHRRNFLDFSLDKEFLGMTPKAQSRKENIDKLDFIKIETYVL